MKRGVVLSPFLLLEKHRQVLAEEAEERQDKADRSAARATKKVGKERERAEKAAAREQLRCRVCSDKEYRGGKAWTGCLSNTFLVCPTFSKSFRAGIAQA